MYVCKFMYVVVHVEYDGVELGESRISCIYTVIIFIIVELSQSLKQKTYLLFIYQLQQQLLLICSSWIRGWQRCTYYRSGVHYEQGRLITIKTSKQIQLQPASCMRSASSALPSLPTVLCLYPAVIVGAPLVTKQQIQSSNNNSGRCSVGIRCWASREDIYNIISSCHLAAAACRRLRQMKDGVHDQAKDAQP